MSEADVDRARLRAERARARLTGALATLKARVMPGEVARRLVDTTKKRAAVATDIGLDAVKTKPAAAVGVATLLGLFLARKPIARVFSSKPKETPPAPPRSSRATVARNGARKPVRKANS